MAAPRGGDVELLQVGVERPGHQRGPKPELRHPVGPAADQQEGRVPALDEPRHPLGEHLHVGNRLRELGVEVVEEPRHLGRVGARRGGARTAQAAQANSEVEKPAFAS